MTNFLQARVKFLEEQNAIFVNNNMLLIKENTLLKQTVEVLEQALAKQKENTHNQQEQLNSQQQEINRLKERLNLNSSNSSLPPSRDLYRKKKENKHQSHRKPGGQAGHQGYIYQPKPPDKIVELKPDLCSCGGSLKIKNRFTAKQRIELPPIKPYVTEYRCYHARCVQCQRKIVAPLPVEVGKDLLGPHAKAIICALNGFCQNSKREVQAILKEIFNLSVSLGLVCDTAKRVNKQLESSYISIQQKIKNSEYLHIDETGHKNKGERGWAWVFTNQEDTLLKLTTSRGQQVLSETLGSYSGKVVSDRYAVYNYFWPDKRQICWSHLTRDFERFAHSLNPSLSAEGTRLVSLSKEIFTLTKAVIKELIKENYYLRRISKVKREIGYIFKKILRIRGIPHAHRVIGRMLKSFSMMWLFVKEKGIAMTNNLAERQLGKYVIYRKKLLFTWSEWGNQYVERMLSLYLSYRLRKDNAFAKLYSFIQNTSLVGV